MKKSAIALSALILTGVILLGNSVAQTPTTASKASAGKPKATSATGKASSPQAKTGTARHKNAPAFTSQKDRTSYAVGMNIADTLRSRKMDLNPEAVAQGLKDALSGARTQMSNAEADSMVMILQGEMKATQQAEQESIAAKQEGQVAERNKKEGETFLAANKAKEGVITLPSGLEYKVLKQGNGPKPAADDVVVCNYRGTLINGTEFDSSYKRGQPLTFPLKGVIRGWTEALQLMPVGSKWQLFVPSNLAYGPRGMGAQIGPNSTLVFEVELMSIQRKETAQNNK